MHCGRRLPMQGDFQGARFSEPLPGDFWPARHDHSLSVLKQVQMSNDGRDGGKGLSLECPTSNNIARGDHPRMLGGLQRERPECRWKTTISPRSQLDIQGSNIRTITVEVEG